ncbi:hypothetical protein [Pedobacter sp. MW01-1-1]|uniref:hypothetical protein n=1 Tax=Pedobacter sp. MW01-1-1 TaxID=3383027 RepID=UPI003FEDFEF7
MKALFFGIFFMLFTMSAFAQRSQQADSVLKVSALRACKTIDSIQVKELSKEALQEVVSDCIQEQVINYQIGMKILNASNSASTATEKDGIMQVDLDITIESNSPAFKNDYNEIKRLLLKQCTSYKKIVQLIE